MSNRGTRIAPGPHAACRARNVDWRTMRAALRRTAVAVAAIASVAAPAAASAGVAAAKPLTLRDARPCALTQTPHPDEDHQTLRGDLDGDGAEETVTATREATTNGLGVSTWKIVISATAPSGAPPLSFDIHEYGVGTFFALPGRAGCGILGSEMAEGEDASGKSGLYFVARPMRYENGALVHDMSLPLLARRYLDSFEKERLRSASIPHPLPSMREPLAWLQHAKVEARAAEPMLDGYRESPGTVTGDVVGVGARPSTWDRVELALRTPEDRIAKVCVGERWEDREKGGCAWQLGDAASGRLYPPGLWPAPGTSWFIGRSARLVTYQGSKLSGTLRILWLDERSSGGPGSP
jgi:hypothetical protein